MSVKVPVAPVTYRTETWASRPHGEGTFARAVVPTVADARLTLDAGLAGDVEAATLALAKVPQPQAYGVPRAAALRALALVEAMASSRVEDVRADVLDAATALARPGRAAGDAALVAGAVDATLLGADASSVYFLGWCALTRDMHRTLLGPDPAWDSRAGSWREDTVWLGGPTSSPLSAAFVPPRHQDVPAAMNDLAAFCDRADLPVLVRSAVAHAHFETVHPFGDGNGRVGRALVQALLVGSGVTDLPVPWSTTVARDPRRYVHALVAYRDGDAAPVVRLLADAVLHAAWLMREVLHGLGAALSVGREALAERVRRDALAYDVLGLSLGWPVLDVALVRDELGASRAGAQRALSALAAAGVLTPGTAGARNRTWLNRPVLDVVDRAARRTR